MDKQSYSPRLLKILENLNRVGSKVNQLSSGDKASVEAVLDLIVDSAVEVVPETSAVIYTYDSESRCFDKESRVAAGKRNIALVGDTPREDGLGSLAIAGGKRILSYDQGVPHIHPINAAAGAMVVACFPLTVAKVHVGALYIYNHNDHPFSEVELLLLENFVFQAAMAIYHARQMTVIQNDLDRREEEATQLHRAGLLISSHPNLNETLEAILTMALEVTDALYGNCMLVSSNQKELEIVATAGECLSRPNLSNIAIKSNTVTGWVARTRQPAIIEDLTQKPWADNYRSFDVDLEMRSELAIPMIGASGRLEGVINLESPRVAAFDERDRLLLQGLATHAVITIQDMMLLDVIKSITHRLLTKPDLEVLVELPNIVIGLLNADASAIWVLEEDELILQTANFDHQHGERVPVFNSLAGEAINKRVPIISENVQTDPRFHRKDLARLQGWEKALVVPMFINKEQAPVGAISVYSKFEESSGRFAESDWDMKVLTILADYGALAVVGAFRKEALDLIKAQHTAAETFAALGDISANLMHQLNNKVGTIPVRVQGIEEKCKSALELEPYLVENLKLIEKNAKEAMQQVRENLSLLKPIEMISVDLQDCLNDAMGLNCPVPDIKIDVEGFSNLPQVKAGKHSLVFIFQNLIENAATAMSGKGKIKILASTKGQWVKIKVSDTGPGIDPRYLDKIFEYSFSESALQTNNKLGFGLWWIKTLLARLGGTISAESDGKNGTTFKLKLPCKPGVTGLESLV
ncbi:MAG: GAF domain-containing sensor histidine kinase [Anaerolineaceae bacterium]|nr:GAF domain-containing sensor histidine kinase [Anaerolineaceae bacterium]